MMAPDTSDLRADAEWQELIGLLRERKSALIADFEHRFPASVLYAGRVSDEEIAHLVDDTMEMYLVLLAGESLDPRLERLPFRLGRDRARQGVSAQLLLEGVRFNSRVIWTALRDLCPTRQLGALVRNTDAVLGLVEWHVREVQRSYLQEEELLNRHSERRRRRAVATLFRQPSLSRADVLALAAELGADSDARYVVVAELGPHHEDCSLCGRQIPGAFEHEVAGGSCHFWPERPDPLEEPGAEFRGAVLRNVEGLDGVPTAVRAALSLLRAVGPSDHAVTAADAWPAVAWSGLVSGISETLLPIDLSALRALPDAARARLCETLEVYFRTGSVKITAEELFCHRNTIVKRLSQFEQLSGLDLGRPAQAALAVLALRHFRA